MLTYHLSVRINRSALDFGQFLQDKSNAQRHLLPLHTVPRSCHVQMREHEDGNIPEKEVKQQKADVRQEVVTRELINQDSNEQD